MGLIHRFRCDLRGNVAMMFSLAVLGLLGLVGLAIDYSRATSVQAQVTGSSDAAVLAGAKNGATVAERKQIAADMFAANVRKIAGVTETKFKAKDVMVNGKFAAFEVSGHVKLETVFGRLFGKRHFEIGFRSQATSGAGDAVEIALALDTTGSMSGAKIATLKTAAANLVTNLNKKALSKDQVKFAVVPFSRYVNVGLSNRNKSWLDVPPDSSTTTNQCTTTTPITSTTNCRDVSYTYTNDGVTHTGTRTVCDYTYGAPVKTCRDVTSSSKWSGCVGSRNHPLNTQDQSYVTKIPGLMNTSCPTSILPMTDDESAVLAAINSMYASGDTYIPAGLIWGWRALSPIEPFSESKKGGPKNVKQVLILMTDGANTRSASYPKHSGNDVVDANTITSEICSNIKTSGGGITIYTIAFGVTDTAIKNILQACATSATKNYFDAADAAQLTAAFESIGQSLMALRLNK